jgi:hypothetical protein
LAVTVTVLLDGLGPIPLTATRRYEYVVLLGTLSVYEVADADGVAICV